jgi:CDP-glucose 4,6-dehydratase
LGKWQGTVDVTGMTAGSFWNRKRVFLTGHTGFKGGWLTLWLSSLGAEVYGFALPPATNPHFFGAANVEGAMAGSTFGDIRDEQSVASAIRSCNPDIVFHLAAQALVRASYARPVETYSTNVMGTVNLLEAVRFAPSVRAVVNVTTDKCYENHEWVWAYRENEPLGGSDPYSSSKACAELVNSAYQKSFFSSGRPALASVRAGNVIGGGDWAEDRLLPDFFRAWDAGRAVRIRSPDAIRPWQHTLEPLSGYLRLAELLFSSGAEFGESWNFGPHEDDARPVIWLASQFASRTGCSWELENAEQPREAVHLKLDSSKARSRLGWHPRWRLATALEKAIEWHSEWRRDGDMRALTLRQIKEYEQSDKRGEE